MSMGNGLRQLWSLMITFDWWLYGLGSRYRKLDVDITGNGNGGEELPEDSILTKLRQIPQNGADFDAREVAVLPQSCPWSTKSRPYLPWRIYYQVKIYELAGKPNFMPFSVSPDLRKPKWMSCGEKHWLSSCQITDLLWRRQRSPELSLICQMMEKLLSKIWFLRGRNQRYSG